MAPTRLALDVARLQGLLDRWDSVSAGPEAFAVHHEIMTYLLEGDGASCNSAPTRAMAIGGSPTRRRSTRRLS